jgi:gamma-glutamyltranspeptidase/glutathione hydrolase/leukotriene-C4 hydrolase
MKEGGSAVDAAVAALLCVGVINNFASGIGGGGFMLVRSGTDGISRVIDFRETAASTAHRDMFNGHLDWATDSTLAAGVPGEIRGFAAAHALYGKLPWSALFQPAIQVATEGFTVTKKLDDMIRRFEGKLANCSGMRETYFNPDGTRKQIGNHIYRPNLAKTLKMIADEGPDSFYTGTIAEDMLSCFRHHEGGLTAGDLAAYEVKLRDPLVRSFGHYRLITAGPPTSGAILAQILQITDSLGLPSSNDSSSQAFPANMNDTRTQQQIIETFKFAYVDRMKLGDPSFVPGIDDVVKKILSEERMQQIIRGIDLNQTHTPEYYLGAEPFDENDSHGTTHLTTMDGSGMAVSVTSTVNLEWGCRRMDPTTGIILNNELDDFSIPQQNNSFGLPPSPANYIEGGKRPLSSASPVILEDARTGQVVLAAGAAGGSRIITAVADAIIKIIMMGMPPDAAVDSCRLHHQLLPDYLMAEDRCDRQLLRQLSHLGHQIKILAPEQYASTVQLIMRNPDGSMFPVSDGRKGGIAAGY